MGFVAAVETDGGREIFSLSPVRRARPAVLEASARRQHLLLLLRQGARERRILFGRDERHLFWAVLPGAERVYGLEAAFEALKPRELRQAAGGPREAPDEIHRSRQPRKEIDGPRDRGASARAIRQGEWFFAPAPDFVPQPWMYARRPFLRRGGTTRRGHDHVADEAVGFVDERGKAWCFVRGAIRHPEHATLHLPFWHSAHLNLEEGKGSAARIGGFPVFD
jgi:hypothetical protein